MCADVTFTLASCLAAAAQVDGYERHLETGVITVRESVNIGHYKLCTRPTPAFGKRVSNPHGLELVIIDQSIHRELVSFNGQDMLTIWPALGREGGVDPHNYFWWNVGGGSRPRIE